MKRVEIRKGKQREDVCVMMCVCLCVRARKREESWREEMARRFLFVIVIRYPTP